MNLNGVEYYYIRNAQNDIIGLFDSDGNQVASYTYDSWGKLISIKDGSGTDITNNTGSVGYKNPYRYRGYRYDTETKLYYLQSRYYNPEWGRFINADDVGGQIGELLSHNVFAYCKNNPVNMVDPDGHFAFALPVLAFAAVAIVVLAIRNVAITNTSSKSISISAAISDSSDDDDRSGPVYVSPPVGATKEEIEETKAYVKGCNEALNAGAISPTGKVSTKGRLRDVASAAAAAERRKAGSSYENKVVGHVPDTTWTGTAVPFKWMPMSSRVNSSIGGQSNAYPVGYKPTVFIFRSR